MISTNINISNSDTIILILIVLILLCWVESMARQPACEWVGCLVLGKMKKALEPHSFKNENDYQFFRVFCWREVPVYCLCALGCFLDLFTFNWEWMLDFVKACSAFFINTDLPLADNKMCIPRCQTKTISEVKHCMSEYVYVAFLLIIFSISIIYFHFFFSFSSFPKNCEKWTVSSFLLKIIYFNFIFLGFGITYDINECFPKYFPYSIWPEFISSQSIIITFFFDILFILHHKIFPN